jgi:DNA-binding transcriptional MerR regulator
MNTALKLGADGLEEAPEDLLQAEACLEKSPDALRTIGEAAAELGLKTHVLRFWETKFDALKPMKRPDGRRYYRPEDLEVLRRLQSLLHVQGLTIRGAIKAMKDGEAGVGEIGVGEDEGEAEEASLLSPDTGASVRDLQAAVREAVERGEFEMPTLELAGAQPSAAAQLADAAAARSRLEHLLADLTGLKSRLDHVRMAG